MLADQSLGIEGGLSYDEPIRLPVQACRSPVDRLAAILALVLLDCFVFFWRANTTSNCSIRSRWSRGDANPSVVAKPSSQPERRRWPIHDMGTTSHLLGGPSGGTRSDLRSSMKTRAVIPGRKRERCIAFPQRLVLEMNDDNDHRCIEKRQSGVSVGSTV